MRRSSTSLASSCGQRRVAELLLDLLDILLDPRCRRERFFMLQACERRLVFLVGEVDADRARREQRDRDERQDEQQVFAEEAAAMHAGRVARRLYGIVHGRHCRHDPRVRPRGSLDHLVGAQQKPPGTVSPSDRAVFRLTTR